MGYKKCVFDKKGRTVYEEEYSTRFILNNPIKQVIRTEYQYDDNDKIIKIISDLFGEIKYFYNDKGLLIKEESDSLGNIEYEYDEEGNLIN